MIKSVCFFLAFIALVSSISSARAQGEGIFATVETSLGNIRFKLEYEKAPLTVANFVGLIEGSQVAVNPDTGTLIKGDYYNGIPFHRVIKGFMIQAGAIGGRPNGGPGYRFPDEFHPELRHDGPFVLSMANSGKNTNGSQFFITLVATPGLDQKHSVFGKAVEGTETVLQIGDVPTDANDRPLEEVTIETITIERIGEAALAFDPAKAGLPQPTVVPAELLRSNEDLFLDVAWMKNSDYQLFHTANLVDWTPRKIGLVGETLPPGPLRITPFTVGQSQQFFRMVEVRYSHVVLVPASMRSSTLTLNVSEFAGFPTQSAVTYSFDSQGGGTAQRNVDQPVPTRTYSYVTDTTELSTLIIPSELIQPLDLVQLVLRFISETTGTFIATLPTALPHPTTMSGSFIIARP